MKLLILGSPTSNAFKAIGLNKDSYGAGWVQNLISELKCKGIELYSLFVTSEIKTLTKGTYDGVTYFAAPYYLGSLSKRITKTTNLFKTLIDTIQPDIVHIIGTEREYNYCLFKAFNKPKRTIVSLTGLITYCAYHYLGHIDRSQLRMKSLGDVIRRWGPLAEQKEFYAASVYERLLLAETINVFGRTTWDRLGSLLINPKLEYRHCGEIINEIYYSKQWDLNKCERHRIFVSQASYPLKGLHILIEALPYILERYPDTKLYVAGEDIFNSSSIKERIKRTTYARFLLKSLKKKGISKDKICFTGFLKPNEMLQQYLKAEVFVLPSLIENSPNSLGESMLVGVPSIAAYVGGIPDMIENGVTGFTYPSDEPYILAKRIMELFEDKATALMISKNARTFARSFFDKNKTIEVTINTYQELINRKN